MPKNIPEKPTIDTVQKITETVLKLNDGDVVAALDALGITITTIAAIALDHHGDDEEALATLTETLQHLGNKAANVLKEIAEMKSQAVN